jgi:integrase
MPLTDIQIKKLKPRDVVYRVADGKGLSLEVTPKGAKLWRHRYRHDGKASMVSLGAYPEVSLAEARDKLVESRAVLRVGMAPAAVRQADKAGKIAAAGNTFGAITLEWFDKQLKKSSEATKKKARRHLGLPNPKPEGRKTRQKPLIPASFQLRPITDITAADVLALLRPVEATGTMETAHRMQQRISQVFRYAIATGRATHNPTADTRGALGPVSRTSRAAITDPQQIAKLMRALDNYDGKATTRAALRLAPLLFVRPGELRALEWSEINWDLREWRIPSPKMKMKKEHIVPLSNQAIGVLEELHALTGDKRFAFPGARTDDKPMSDGAVNKALRLLGFEKDEMTGHGFRAMASTRLNELGWAPHVIERQLAHEERNKIVASYNRASYMDERRKMMQAWADYLDALRVTPDKVVPIRRKKAS